MSKEELTLEEAENIVDNMYQNRWKECGVEDGNTIHMNNLEKLHYSKLERASILLLRTEIRLKRENQELKKQLEEINDFISKAGFVNIQQLMLDYCAKIEQQKEFIECLENEINEINEQIKNYDIWHELGTDINFLILKKQFNIEILSKYKEIVGGSNENRRN